MKNSRFACSAASGRRWPGTHRWGIVLVIVLIVVASLALAGYSFVGRMLIYAEAAQLSGQQVQTRAYVQSGVASVIRLLSMDESDRDEVGGLQENPGRFRAVIVTDGSSGSQRGGFTVLSPKFDEQDRPDGVRYGLERESERLNVYSALLADQQRSGAGRRLLMTLPGMNEEIADAILDWLDADDQTREFGAESDYYVSLPRPYACKNGALNNIEELLLVRGITPRLLFGSDLNHNGLIDPNEECLAGSASAFPGGDEDLGWARYLTIYTRFEHPRNEISEGAVDVNQEDMEHLYQELLDATNKQWAMFIVAYRQHGQHDGEALLENATSRDLNLLEPATVRIEHVLDLVDCNVQVRLVGDDQPVVLSSPFRSDGGPQYYLPELLTKLKVDEGQSLPGAVDLFTAPRRVLAGLPGMDAATLEAILARREHPQQIDARLRDNGLWLFTEGHITLEQMRTLAPLVGKSDSVYRAQVVGYFHDGTAFDRAELVVRADGGRPKMLMYRDLTRLGRGFSLETLGVERARSP